MASQVPGTMPASTRLPEDPRPDDQRQLPQHPEQMPRRRPRCAAARSTHRRNAPGLRVSGASASGTGRNAVVVGGKSSMAVRGYVAAPTWGQRDSPGPTYYRGPMPGPLTTVGRGRRDRLPAGRSRRRPATAVRLWCDLELGGHRVRPRCPAAGRCDLPSAAPRPRVDRIEYLFDVDGAASASTRATRCRCPAPSATTRGSPLPGYAAPAWLDVAPGAGGRVAATVEDTPVDGSTSRSGRRPTPRPASRCRCCIAHDGPEMDSFGGLTRYVGALIAAGGCRRCGWRCSPRASATRATPPTRRTPPRSSTTWSRCCAEACPSNDAAGADGPEPRRARRAARGLDGAGHLRAGCSCRAGRSSPPSSTRRSRASSTSPR